MSKLQEHLRTTFLAGLFTGVPIGVTVFLVWKFDETTRGLSQSLFNRSLPFVGVLIAIGGIYLSGFLATSLVGRFFLGILDALLIRVPVLKQLYTAWKQVAFVPSGTEGTFSRVVLIGDETAQFQIMGFCSGKPIDGDTDMYCVFVPAAPNPFSGSRLFFVRGEKIKWLAISTEEAFKLVVSNGNYIPRAVGDLTSSLVTSSLPSPHATIPGTSAAIPNGVPVTPLLDLPVPTRP